MKNKIKISKELIPIIAISILVLIVFRIVQYNLSKNAEYEENLILAGGCGITIISWFVVGYINNENEKKRNRLSIEQSTLQAKRDLKIKFLLDAYFRLENTDYRDLAPEGHRVPLYDFLYLKFVESALTSIQLLANPSTVELAVKHITSGGNHYSDLLLALRAELREQLNLEELPTTKEYWPSSYRTFRKNEAIQPLTTDQEYELTIKLIELTRGLIK